MTTHYSSNAIYCSVTLIVLTVRYYRTQENSRNKRITLILASLSLLALLLTTKRGHLVFSLAAIMLSYFICARGAKSGRLFKAAFYGVIVLSIFLIIGQYIPMLSSVIDRFTNTADISTGRYLIWQQALSGFAQNRIFGIGWRGYFYRILHGSTYFGYTNAHNVYIQLLCERGLIGLLFVIFLYTHILVVSVRLFNQLKETGESFWADRIAVSIGVQIFFIIYGFTGCDLYDFTFVAYILQCASVMMIAKTFKFNTIRKKKNGISINQ